MCVSSAKASVLRCRDFRLEIASKTKGMVVPKVTAKELQSIRCEFASFHKSGLIFSSYRKRLIDRYPEQWVAVFDGKVKAHDPNYQSVLSKIDEDGIPRQLTLIRFITRNEGSMIL